MYNSDGKIFLNQWGEIKFICPDGAHRCRIQLEKWMENNKRSPADIVCYGRWHPYLDHTTPEGRKEIYTLGKCTQMLFKNTFLITYLS